MSSAESLICVNADSRLSDDVLLIQALSVDPAALAGASIAATRSGDVHLFAILAGQGAAEVRPTANSASGYTATLLPDGAGAQQIVCLVDRSDVLHAFYANDTAVLHTWRTQDGCWNSPDRLPLSSSLSATQVPFGGHWTVYGVSPEGNLMLYTGDSSSWTSAKVDFSTKLLGANVRLQYTSGGSDASWVLAAAGLGPLQLWSGFGTQVSSLPLSVPGVGAAMKVLFSYMHASSPIFMFTDAQNRLYTGANFADALVPITLSNVTTGAGIVGDDGFIRLYATDPDGKLWVLRQTAWDTQGAPQWAPLFPLDVNVSFVAAPLLTGGSSALLVSRLDGTLDYLRQPAVDALWTRSTIHSDDLVPVHTTRYRTRISLSRADNAPCAGVAVTLIPSEAVALEVAGQTVFASPDQPAVLMADAAGEVQFSQAAHSLEAVRFSIRGESFLPTSDIEPYDYLHENLAGQSEIFTGSTALPSLSAQSLQAATVDAQPLAPGLSSDMADVATRAIQLSLSLAGRGALASEAAGFEFDLRNASSPSVILYRTQDELQARIDSLDRSSPASPWDGIARFGSDVWRAIKSGAMKVVHWIVDTTKKVMSITVQIAGDIEATLKNLVIDGIRDIGKAVSFIHGILASIGAAIETAIRWLKDLFCWDDIWNTMKAFEAYVSDGLQSLTTLLGETAPIASGSFFKNIKGDIDGQLDHAISMLGQQPIGPSASQSVMSRLPGSRCQHNWLLSKVLAHAPAGFTNSATWPLGDSFFTQLQSALQTSGFATDSSAALAAVRKFFTDLGANPAHLQNVIAADLLSLLRALIDVALDCADAIVKVLLGVAAEMIRAVHDDFDKKLPDIPVISWLWKELQPHGEDLPLTLGRLLCLTFAAPVTLVYKLTHANTAPFKSSHTTAAQLADTDANSKVLDDVSFIFSFVLAGADMLNDCVNAGANQSDSEATPQTLLVNRLNGGANLIAQCLYVATATIEIPSHPTYGQKLSYYAAIGYSWPVVFDVVVTLRETYLFKTGGEDPDLATISLGFDGLFGVILIGMGVAGAAYEIEEKTPDAGVGEVLEAYFGPLPWVTQYLVTREVVDATEGASVGLQCLIDILADVDVTYTPATIGHYATGRSPTKFLSNGAEL